MTKFKVILSLFSLVSLASCKTNEAVTVGSKTFTESYILGEVLAQSLEDDGLQVEKRLGLGDTALVFAAIEKGDVDFYVEYTGTISSALLKKAQLTSPAEIRSALRAKGLTISDPIGFNNTYAVVVRESIAKERNLKTIGDLKSQTGLTVAFTPAFMERPDSYPKLQEVYGLDLPNLNGISHGLKATALTEGKIDVTDLYTTDAQLADLDLRILMDNKHAFPNYDAVVLARIEATEKFPKQWASLRERLEGKISEAEMISFNARVETDGQTFPKVAAAFLGKTAPETEAKGIPWTDLWRWLTEHLFLVFIPLTFSVLVGVPLAVFARNRKLLGQSILLLTGTVQAIPSLALLCFLLPLLGIGSLPAMVALFLYALLPIVRNTYSGLVDIDPKLLEVSDAMGLSPLEKLRKIELPLASRSITSGIKIAAVINVGTATIAALIGAGGFGQPIVVGLNTNKLELVFLGAVPAALLALAIHALFELFDRVLIPTGLQD